MFSKKIVLSAGAIGLVILITFVFTFYFLRKTTFMDAAARAALSLVAPVQSIFTSTTGFIDDIWKHYFFLVSVSHDNDVLRQRLADAVGQIDACREAIIANARLREYVGLMDENAHQMVAAEIVAKDPSPWYHTVTINKGVDSGVCKGCPVILPDGIPCSVFSLPDPPRQTVHSVTKAENGRVTFRYPAKNVSNITVAGDFNHWDPYMYSLDRDTLDGEFYSLTLPLPQGTYHYYFVVDGRRVTDPANPQLTRKSDGSLVSILRVGG